MTSKNIKLPFKIGTAYEKWELDLEPLEQDRIKGYDSYLYLKDVVFMGFKSTETELIFCLDELRVVIFKYKQATQQLYKEIYSMILNVLAETSNLEKENVRIHCFKMKSLYLWLIYNPDSFIIEMVYGYEEVLKLL